MPIDRDKAHEIASNPEDYSYEDLFAAADAIANNADNWDNDYLDHKLPDREVSGSVDWLPDHDVDKLWRNDW